MAQFERYFTLSEANALIPWVRSIFGKIGRMVDEMTAERQAGRPMAAGRANGNALRRKANPITGGGEVNVDPPWTHLASADKVELVNGLLASIQKKGIVIQDVRRGLIDFPAWRGEQEVLLCYELSDGDQIGFWHDLEAGYAGRRPIDELIQQ